MTGYPNDYALLNSLMILDFGFLPNVGRRVSLYQFILLHSRVCVAADNCFYNNPPKDLSYHEFFAFKPLTELPVDSWGPETKTNALATSPTFLILFLGSSWSSRRLPAQRPNVIGPSWRLFAFSNLIQWGDRGSSSHGIPAWWSYFHFPFPHFLSVRKAMVCGMTWLFRSKLIFHCGFNHPDVSSPNGSVVNKLSHQKWSSQYLSRISITIHFSWKAHPLWPFRSSKHHYKSLYRSTYFGSGFSLSFAFRSVLPLILTLASLISPPPASLSSLAT